MNFYNAGWWCFACFSGKAWYNFGECAVAVCGNAVKAARKYAVRKARPIIPIKRNLIVKAARRQTRCRRGGGAEGGEYAQTCEHG